MPSASHSVPPEAAAVAQRYRRLERPVSAAVAVVGAVVAVAPLLVVPYVPALVWAGLVVVALRAPLFRTSGTARLSTDAPVEAVTDAFDGPTPPFLEFQWGIADTVRTNDAGATYEVSYLFGLRTVRMQTESRSVPAPDDAFAQFELTATKSGDPWGSYDVTVCTRDGQTVVDAEWQSDRRFGLRRLPQQLIARRHRADALAARGYTVEAYEPAVTLSRT